MVYKIAVLINTRDRPTELSLLLQSLRTQTFKDFKIYILDDCSGTPIQAYHFLMCMIGKCNDEGNHVHYQKTEFPHGVSKARQRIVDWALKDDDTELFLRVDDDVILEPTYISKLMEVIKNGYDFASGVTPFMGQPQFRRDVKNVGPVMDRVVIDNEGNIVFNGDDCGMLYHQESVLPLHHFRSCALYKKEIHQKVSYDNRLTKHGFREEEILSFKLITAGYKLGCNTGAIAWHLLTPSGGERFADSNELVKINEEELKRFTKELYKEKGDFIEEYNKRLGISVQKMSDEELIKSTNLIIK